MVVRTVYEAQQHNPANPKPPASGLDSGEFEAAVAKAASAANPAATPAPSSRRAGAQGSTLRSRPKPASATLASSKQPAAQPSNGARPSSRNPAPAAKTTAAKTTAAKTTAVNTTAVTTPDEQLKQIDQKIADSIEQPIPKLEYEPLPTVVSQEVPLIEGIVTATYDLELPKEKPTNDPSVLYKRFYEAQRRNDFPAAYSNAIQYIEKFESSKQFDPNDKYYRTVATWLSTSALRTMYANVRAAGTDVGSSHHWSSQTLQLAGLCKRFDFLSAEQKKYVDGFIERAGSWKQRLERNSNVTIDVSDWTASRKNPTHAEIAERIAATLGYDRRMMEAFARAQGKQDASEAFFHFLSAGDKNAQIARWMDESRKNGAKSATVWELNSGTLEYAKRWLDAYKQTESALTRYEAALKQSADPAERKELSEQVVRMKAQLNGERPLIEKAKFDQYWKLHQLILEIQRGPLPAVQAGADWVLDKLEKASRPVQFLSTAIAGTQWAMLTREAAVLGDNKMSRRLAEYKYTPAAILDAAAERFWTGKVRPGFEQPVAEFYKAAVEEYGGDPEAAVHQFFYTVLEVGTDPTTWGVAELAALKVISKVGKVTRIARVEGKLAKEVAAGARLGDDAVRNAGVRPNGKAPEVVHSGPVADDAVKAAAERNNTARLNPPDGAQQMIDEAAESVGKGRIGAGPDNAGKAAEKAAAERVSVDHNATSTIDDATRPNGSGRLSDDADAVMEYRVRHDAPDVCADANAVRQANRYKETGEIRERLATGFQTLGGRQRIGPDGKWSDSYRPSAVVDRTQDNVLSQTIDEAHARFDKFKNDPERLAQELAIFSKKKMEPKGWTAKEVDESYLEFRKQNAGKRILLGDYIRRAANGTGAGVCQHQALLFKVLADDFGLDATLVGGVYSPDGVARLPANQLGNHAWNKVRLNGKDRLIDPRNIDPWNQNAFVPEHKLANYNGLSGREGSTRELKHAQAGVKPGDEVTYGGSRWRVSDESSTESGKIVLRHEGFRNISNDDFVKWNPGSKLEEGGQYQIIRNNGQRELGWIYEGKNSDGTLRFTNRDAFRREVHPHELRISAGSKVQYRGEEFTLVQYDTRSGKPILFQNGRGKAWAKVYDNVTEAELKAKYDEIVVNGKRMLIDKKRVHIYSAADMGNGNFLVGPDEQYVLWDEAREPGALQMRRP